MNLTQYLEAENIVLSDDIIIQLENFSSTLHQWNKIHNLTGAKDIDTIYQNILDSLYPLSFISTPKTLLDVGTGAGFPGLILAIALPQTKVVLAEPLKKRVSFLKYICVDLALDNVKVEASKVENLSYEAFELISSRAVTNTNLLLSLTEKISNHQTKYLFYKGSRLFDEIKDISYHLEYDIIQKNKRNYLYIKSK